jgi:hypothetical protein
MSRKKHSVGEIEVKLAQASELATQGKLQGDIAAALGVSVMTLHRWRKACAKPQQLLSIDDAAHCEHEIGQSQRVADLQLENARLRRLVTDLLLEKMKLEESAEDGKWSRERITAR